MKNDAYARRNPTRLADKRKTLERRAARRVKEVIVTVPHEFQDRYAA